MSQERVYREFYEFVKEKIEYNIPDLSFVSRVSLAEKSCKAQIDVINQELEDKGECEKATSEFSRLKDFWFSVHNALSEKHTGGFMKDAATVRSLFKQTFPEYVKIKPTNEKCEFVLRIEKSENVRDTFSDYANSTVRNFSILRAWIGERITLQMVDGVIIGDGVNTCWLRGFDERNFYLSFLSLPGNYPPLPVEISKVESFTING